MPDKSTHNIAGDTIRLLDNDQILKINTYITKILRRYLGEKDQATIDDIIQDTWVYLLSRQDRTEHLRHLKRYAGTVAKHKLMIQRRKMEAAYKKQTVQITDNIPDYRGIPYVWNRIIGRRNHV